MTIFKCKMCGGTLEFNPGDTVAVCDSCGTKQTLPKLDDDRRANLYDRANHFRRSNEYDKAMGIYEQILAEDNTDAEAYWSLVLCRYGIEYVEDPATHRRVPTVNRAQFTSIFDDDNYKSALHYADAAQREVYESEAKAINEIQKGILAISQKEQPFDVFICYKETDNSGRRTPDSVLANDLYHQLTQEGFKVFFARITLEDKLGTAYEPYIFAALNSAKVMVVLGTKPEYFNAVWVKNEWSRYLALVKNSGGKKMLIPAYKDMDPYDLPEEFSHLQAQDMGKLGFMQDLIRGIKKIISADAPKATVKETVVVGGGSAGVAPLLKRAFMFLEDGNWQEADAYCEKVLDIEPENARAYLGKLMAELQVHTQEGLIDCKAPFDGSDNYRKAIRFGDESLQQMLTSTVDGISARNEENRLSGIYQNAQSKMAIAGAEDDYTAAALLFESISEYRDAAALGEECRDKAETARKDAIFAAGNAALEKAKSISDYEAALERFASIPGWKNADENAALCQRRMEEIRLETERKKEAHRVAAEAAKKKAKKIAIIVGPIACVCVAVAILLTTVIIPNQKRNKAMQMLESGDYDEAFAILEELGDSDTITSAKYDIALKLIDSEKYEDAYVILDELGNSDTAISAKYDIALKLADSGESAKAAMIFTKLDDYSDARERANELLTDLIPQKIISATISAGEDYTVALRTDGTVLATGNNDEGQCNVGNWTDIVSVSAGEAHTVGLRSDGTVVATGNNDNGQCNISDWKNIIAVAAGNCHTVGLRIDGTVVATGGNTAGQCNVSNWTNIVSICAGSYKSLGLKADGTVVATAWATDFSEWKNIVAISSSLTGTRTVGLRSDGTIVEAGSAMEGQNNPDDWTDLISVSASGYDIGLHSNGTVVVQNSSLGGIQPADVSGWTDIVAVSGGISHVIGLKSDGTMVAAGWNGKGQCNISDWIGIAVPN